VIKANFTCAMHHEYVLTNSFSPLEPM